MKRKFRDNSLVIDLTYSTASSCSSNTIDLTNTLDENSAGPSTKYVDCKYLRLSSQKLEEIWQGTVMKVRSTLYRKAIEYNPWSIRAAEMLENQAPRQSIFANYIDLSADESDEEEIYWYWWNTSSTKKQKLITSYYAI